MSIRTELIEALEYKEVDIDTELKAKGIDTSKTVSLFDLIDLVGDIPSKNNIIIIPTPEIQYSPQSHEYYNIYHLHEVIQNLQIRLCNYLLSKNVRYGSITHNTSLTTLISCIKEIERADPVELSINATNTNPNIGETIKIAGVLTSKGTPVSNQNIVLTCSNPLTPDQTKTTNSSGSVSFDDVKQTINGKYTYTLIFTSTSKYASINNSIEINFNKFTTSITQSFNKQVQAYTDFNITATLGDSTITDGTMNLYINDSLYKSITPSAGESVFTVSKNDYKEGTYSLYIEWTGNSKYSSTKTIADSFVIKKYSSSITLTLNNSSIINQTIRILNGTNIVLQSTGIGNISISNGSISNTKSNTVSLEFIGYTGTYNIVAESTGNESYTGAKVIATIVVYNKTPTSISLQSLSGSSVNVGTSISLKATISPAINGTVRFKDGTTNIGEVVASNGVATLTSYNLGSVKTYSFYAEYIGNYGDYSGSGNSNAVYIEAVNPYTTVTPTVSISPTSVYVGGNTVFTISTDAQTDLSYSVDSGSYSTTKTFSKTFTSEGDKTINIRTQQKTVGYTIYSAINNNYTVHIRKPTLNLSEQTSGGLYYGWYYKVRATATELNNTPVSNVSIYLKINGQTLSANTDNNGYASFGPLNFANQTFNASVGSNDSNYYVQNYTTNIVFNDFLTADTGWVGPSIVGSQSNGGVDWVSTTLSSTNLLTNGDSKNAITNTIPSGNKPYRIYGNQFNCSFSGKLYSVTKIAAGCSCSVMPSATASPSFDTCQIFATYNGTEYINATNSGPTSSSNITRVADSGNVSLSSFNGNNLYVYITLGTNNGGAGIVRMDQIAVKISYQYSPTQ